MATQPIFTVGHWHRSIDEFVGMLHEYGIEMLVDVRSSPTSHASPQFYKAQPRDERTNELLYPNILAMPNWLRNNGIRYTHIADIGGHRHVKHVCHDNDGWQNASFRNYADYTMTDVWKRGFEQLVQIGSRHRIVMTCGEPHPSRCHRLLLSNSLVANGIDVYHIIKPKQDEPSHLEQHTLGKWGARPVVDGKRIIYPSEQIRLEV